MDLFEEAQTTKGTDNVTTPTTPTQPTGTQEPTQPNFLDELVGEDKKYKDVNALAKSRLDADNYIGNLEKQVGELNAELSQRLSSEEVLNEIKKQKSIETAADSSREHTTPALDEAAVADMVRNQMTVLESQKTAQANLNDAVEDLMSATGSKEKAIESIDARAKELNVTVDFLKETAAKSPTAFKSLMNTADAKPAPVNLHGTSANTEALKVNNPNAAEGSKEYFDNIRKTDPAKYFTPKVQQAIIGRQLLEGKYSLIKYSII